MSQSDERPRDQVDPQAVESDVALPEVDGAEDDVSGHVYTGALQDKNQQP